MKPILLSVLALLLVAPAAHALDLGRTTTVDRPPGALPYDGLSSSSTSDRSLSDDGRYVAMESGSDVLWGPFPGKARGIYRVDLQTGAVVLASIGTDGAPMAGAVGGPSISGNGRFVAFHTDVAAAPADTNTVNDVYLRDLQLNQTTLVSCRDGSADCTVDPAVPAQDAVVSGDGSTVAFRTAADLTDGTIDDTDGEIDVYARRAGETHLVSVGDNDAADNTANDVGDIDINSDGTSIAFAIETDLETNPDVTDTGTEDVDVFLRTGVGTASPATECASHGGGVMRVAIGGSDPSIADTTDRVAFITRTNVGTDTDADQDAYTQRADSTADPVLISAANGTADGEHNALVEDPLINGAGDAVVFEALGSGLVTGVTGKHVYLRGGTTTTVMDRANNPLGALTTTGGSAAGFARDDPTVAFTTSDALDPADGPGTFDVYVRKSATTTWVSKPPTGPTLLGAGVAAISQGQVMSQDGRYVVFVSDAPALGSGQGAYRRDLVTGEVVRVDVKPGGGAPDGPASTPSISADGSRVAFTSPATDLVAGDANNALDVFVRDLATEETKLVAGGPGDAFGGDLSGDGRRVLVITPRTLHADDTNSNFDVYVADPDTGAVTLASRSGDGAVQAESATGAAMSADGNRVAFTTDATNMPDGDAQEDVYLRDIAASTTTVVSRTASGETMNAPAAASEVDISADGNRVALHTTATNLGDGDTDAQGDIHVRDLAAGTLTWASRTPTGALNEGAFGARLSADGHKVLFGSDATNADPADTSTDTSPFLKDLDTGALTLAARTDAGGSPTADVGSFAISDSAGCVAFTTDASGVDPDGYPSRDYPHVYVHALSHSCPGAPAVMPPTPGPGPDGDTTKPVITGLKVKSARKRRVTVTFDLSEDADVRLRALRLVRGTRRDGKCGRKRPRGKRCTRLVARGTVTRAAQQGEVKIVLKGKAGKRRLARGRHRIELRATDAAGNASARKRSKRFRVKR